MNIGWYSETFARELVKDYDRRTLARREGRGKRKRAPRGIPTAGGGSGNGLVKFSVESASEAIGQGIIGCNFVVATVTYVGCANSGGAAVGDEIVVFDPEYCYFNLPIDLITNLQGTAQQFQNPFTEYDDEVAEDCQYGLTSQGECIWVVTDVCCAEEYPF